MRGSVVRICISLALLWSGGSGAAAVAQQAPAADRINVTSASSTAPLLSPAQWRRQQLLRATVAHYPQLLDGHANASVAEVGLALRPDGSIALGEIGFAGSAPGVVNLSGQGLIVMQAIVGVLRDTSGTDVLMESWEAGAPTPQGRPLAINLNLYHTRVPADFDAGRSATRVRGIVRRHHTDLLYTGDNTRNRLTVLLDEDGSLLNRHVDRVEWAYDPPAPVGATEVMARARELAQRLRIDVTQVGLLGHTVVREGGEWYHVAYAWQRRPGESEPQAMQPLPPLPPQLDLAAAEAIVRQHFAAAASPAEASKTPAVVLSAAGEVLRTGYVPMQNGGLTRQGLQDPLLAGARVQDVLLHPVGQGSGAARPVLFVWEAAREPDARSVPAVVPVQGVRR